jgi:CheY-like chemotaxis protein
MASNDGTLEPQRGAASGSPRAAGRSVFVVEDDAALRTMLGRHLRSRGYRVLEAGDAESAVRQLIEESAFDLVITDIHLPGLSGVELLGLIHARSPMRPVLVMTGDDQDQLARRSLAGGATGYLVKPFHLAELDANVEQSLQRLELLERLGEILDAPPTSEFGVPLEWLDMADRRSSAGAGHGARVERLGMVLARGLGVAPEEAPLRAAARVHELGRLTAAEQTEDAVPALTARILAQIGSPPAVRDLVARMGAWWSGPGREGGPGTDVAAALTAADRLDHGATERVARGATPPVAIMETLEALSPAIEARLGPTVGRALRDSADVLSGMWILGRGGYDATSTGGGVRGGGMP